MFLEFVEEQMILFVALGVIAVMLVFSYFSDKMAGYNSVNADEAVHLYNNDAKVFDVRTPAEFKGGYIGEAENITTEALLKKVENLSLAKETPILIYCESGMRSGTTAKKLVKAGYTNINNLSGGILAWQNASLPINKPVSKKKQKKDKKGN